jgi:hypothetical protein
VEPYDNSFKTVSCLEIAMAGRQGKLRIESLGELKKTLTENSVCEFALLVRGERKVEMELDAKVIAELQKWLQKAAGNRGDDD